MLISANSTLLPAIRSALAPLSIYWVLGGACSGKSTVCSALAERYRLPVYDMDAAIYGAYIPRYNAERHPAATVYFRAENPLAWVLGLSWEEFDALNLATDVEYLDLFAEDMVDLAPRHPLLVDGGLTHPALLAQVLEPWRIVCLAVDPELSARTWNTDPARLEMKEAVSALPDGEAAWSRFLDFDRLLSSTLENEAREAGIALLSRQESAPTISLAEALAQHWSLSQA